MRAERSPTELVSPIAALWWSLTFLGCSCHCEEGAAPTTSSGPQAALPRPSSSAALPSHVGRRRAPVDLVNESPPKKVGEVSFFRRGANRSFGMAPSISADGRWVAAVVDETDTDSEQEEQRLVVKRVDSDRLEASLFLGRVYDDGRDGMGTQMPGKMLAEYQANADRANRLLASVVWRELVRCDDPAKTCAVVYREPDLLVTGPEGPLFDAAMPSWSAAVPAACEGANRAFGGPAFCDRASNVMLIETIFVGGHVGCQAPFPEIHAVQLSSIDGCFPSVTESSSGTHP